MALKLVSTVQGDIGEFHKVEVKDDEFLVFQLPRPTEHLSTNYIDNAKGAIEAVLPDGVNAVVIGADVDIYTMAAEDALALKLKGFL